MAIVKLCPECDGKLPIEARVCPHCGYDEDCPCCYLHLKEKEDYLWLPFPW